MYRFCAIVILFNPENTFSKSLQTYSRVFEKVFLIDNSNIISNEISNLTDTVKNVMYRKMDSNRGISHALNFGFNLAIKEDYDFILTMDQDSIYTEDNIKTMINYINNNDKNNYGIYAANYCRIYSNKNNELVYSNPRYSTNKVSKVLCAITSGSFVKTKALKKILPLDENYFIANVDVDMGAQMLLAGYSTILVGHSIFYQQVGGMVKQTAIGKRLRFTNYATTRYYYQVRNTFYLLKKYNKLYRFKLFAYKQLAKYIFKIFTSEKNKIEKIRMGYLGYLDFSKGKMGKKAEID